MQRKVLSDRSHRNFRQAVNHATAKVASSLSSQSKSRHVYAWVITTCGQTGTNVFPRRELSVVLSSESDKLLRYQQGPLSMAMCMLTCTFTVPMMFSSFSSLEVEGSIASTLPQSKFSHAWSIPRATRSVSVSQRQAAIRRLVRSNRSSTSQYRTFARGQCRLPPSHLLITVRRLLP